MEKSARTSLSSGDSPSTSAKENRHRISNTQTTSGTNNWPKQRTFATLGDEAGSSLIKTEIVRSSRTDKIRVISKEPS